LPPNYLREMQQKQGINFINKVNNIVHGKIAGKITSKTYLNEALDISDLFISSISSTNRIQRREKRDKHDLKATKILNFYPKLYRYSNLRYLKVTTKTLTMMKIISVYTCNLPISRYLDNVEINSQVFQIIILNYIFLCFLSKSISKSNLFFFYLYFTFTFNIT
jgi:hypothetical protein